MSGFERRESWGLCGNVCCHLWMGGDGKARTGNSNEEVVDFLKFFSLLTSSFRLTILQHMTILETSKVHKNTVVCVCLCSKLKN